MTDQPHYPYADGDITVLGPEVFASADGQTISWKGANYSRHPGEIHCLCGGISVVHEIRGAAKPDDDTPPEFTDEEARNLASTAYRQAVQRIESAGPKPAGHDDGPSVEECAEADRVWPLQKEGE